MSTTPGTPNTDYQPLSFDQAIQFYWGAPSDGGSPILDYRLTLNYSGGSLVYTPAATDITYLATGLTNAVTYSATLEARNANGYSAVPGTYREWQAGFKPNPPSTVTATLVGANSATIAWTPPTVSPLAPIYWYVIEAYSTNSSVPSMYSANGLTQSNFFIPGLNSNLAYYFDVYSVNYPDYSAPVRTSTIRYLFPFQPNYITGLQLWLDASDSGTLSLSGSSVTAWQDKNTPAKTTTLSATKPVQVIGSLNSLNTVQFTGASSTSLSASLATAIGTGNITMIALWKTTTGAIAQAVTGLGAGPGMGYNNSSSRYNVYDFGVVESQYAGLGVNTWLIQVGQRQSGAMNVFVNGNSPTTTGSSTNNFTNTSMTVGAGPVGLFTTGEIAETLFYNTLITPFDRQKVEGYLAWKWGIQTILPTSHPFRAAAPYSNTVFAPTMFSSLQIWYDGADPQGTGSAPANGTPIATWVDKSGRVNNATACNAASYVVSSNGNYLNFNGVDTWYRITDGTFLVNQYNTIFIVEKLQKNTGDSITLISGSANTAPNNLLIRYNGGTSQHQYTYYGTGSLFASGLSYSGATQPSRIWSYAQNPSSGEMFLNGTSVATNTNNTLLSSWPTPSIGRDSESQSRYYGGQLYEIIFYRGVLPPDNRQTVEGYLAWKWGLQSNLPGTHPYYDNNPGVLPPTIFTPSNFNSLSLWLDASDSNTFTYSGLNITAWADKSGTSNNLSYTSGGSYATRTTDAGKTIVQFPNAASQYNSANTATYTTNLFTIFYVMKKTNTKYTQWLAAGGVNTIYDYGPFLGCLYNGPSSGAGDGSSFFTVNGSRNTVNSATYTTYHIVRGTGNGGTTNVRVGVNHPSDYFYGSICEILVYNRKALLTEQQAQQVEGYLAWKWGLQNTLPYTHPYKFVNPAAATTGAIVSSGLLIEFDANIYGGGGFWPNTGSLGQGYNASPTGTISKNAAGNGVVFGGSSFYSFPDIAVGNAWTVSMWIKRTGTPTGTPCYITQQWSSLPNPINLMISANNQGASSTQCIGNFFYNSAWRNGTPMDLPLNTWRQIVCTWNGSVMVSYINGASFASNTLTGAIAQNGGLQYYIGKRWDNPDYIIAEIGQVLIYNRALSATEVSQNYTVTSNIFSV